MMLSPYGASFLILWGLFWGYWVFRARSTKQGERVESGKSRLIHAILLALTLALLMIALVYPLTIRVLPQSDLIFALGFLIALLGLALAIWARLHLGQYWSGAITLTRDHQLVRTGPYAFVRHPIYTGILFGILGTAISMGEVRGFLAFMIALVAYYRKVQMEEDFLVRQFSEYAQYRKAVRSLVPFVF